MKFNLAAEIARATQAWLASNTVGIPASIMKPVSGECIECREDTEDRQEGEWLCDSCSDSLNRKYREGCRLDDPRDGQGDR